MFWFPAHRPSFRVKCRVNRFGDIEWVVQQRVRWLWWAWWEPRTREREQADALKAMQRYAEHDRARREAGDLPVIPYEPN